MNIENETTIPYIDDGEAEEAQEEEEEEEEGEQHQDLADEINQYNLRITRNYQTKTRRVEISKILQNVEPIGSRSLSPVAPLVCDSGYLVTEVSNRETTAKNEEDPPTGAEFELTIKSNNSVIRIQGFDKSLITFNARKAKGDNVYEFLSKEVEKVFKKPEKSEIEKAIRSIDGLRNGTKLTKGDKRAKGMRQKRNTWKLLARSLISVRGEKCARQERRGSIERYPKMVLLQDPIVNAEERNFPKMVMLETVKSEKEIFANEKSTLQMKNEEIEICKTELNRSRKQLNEEKRILKEKKESIKDKKSILEGENATNGEYLKTELDLLEEEKLCVELEKQLLGEEKIMLKEEMDILEKEKAMLQTEKNLLGEEKNVLEEEKTMLQRKLHEVQSHERQKFIDEIDDVFQRTQNLYSSLKPCRKQRKEIEKSEPPQQEVNFDSSDVSYSSIPPLYCQYTGHDPFHCPSIYIPVYNRPTPYYHYNDICCGGRLEPPPTQNSTTQTNGTALADAQLQTDPMDQQKDEKEEQRIDTDVDVPFGLLSSFFPRIVVMKSFQEEVSGDDTDPKIFELSKGDSPKQSSAGKNGNEGEEGCQEFVQDVDVNREVKDSSSIMEKIEVQEEWDRGMDTEEFPIDVNITKSNHTNGEIADDLPLTNIGHIIYDRLTELREERKKGFVEGGANAEGETETEAEDERDQTKPCNVTFEFSNKVVNCSVRDDNINFKIHDAEERTTLATADTERKYVAEEKIAVRKSELWLPSNGVKIRNDEIPIKGTNAMTFSVSDRQNLIFRIQLEERPSRGTREAKVGTDGIDIVGGDHFCPEGTDSIDLSPRTDRILKRLREKLETIEGNKKMPNKCKNREFEFPALFLVKQIDTGRKFPGDDYVITKDRARKTLRKEPEPKTPAKVREYYCEECLATMRLFEDECLSVKNIVDKFETIIELGNY